LFFNFHEIGSGILVGFISLYGTRGVYCTPKKQELFGKRSFSGIRVTDNGEGFSFVYFRIAHKDFWDSMLTERIVLARRIKAEYAGQVSLRRKGTFF
jgi:hypothetical protein